MHGRGESVIDPAMARSAARLRDFLHDCIASTRDEEGDRIREAAVLLRGGARHGLQNQMAGIEAMLKAGAGVSAALAVIGESPSFMLSRGGDGACLASFALSDGGEDTVAEGETLALSLLAAHVSALLTDLEQGGGWGLASASEAHVRLH